ncbi:MULTISPECIES: hypothetical protein [Clostridium]|uniref:hypothetical protein n=1 Tax=Clostridium TaxID=1485 RepID=UPI0002CC584A|nr:MULTISPECIES: hypothetical protein [Clostridium]EMU54896.1 hypothetical protein CBDKU1_11080 [Clostridium butyricum DKU-01]POO86518.1 dipeptidyl-peptidase IV [Clostridium sp. 3-3]
MKYIKRFVAWAILSLIIQVGALFILDRVIFKQSSAFESKKIELDKPYEDKINIKIPKDADEIKVSYNGKYMSYSKGDKLNMIETKSGKDKSIETENKGEVMYYEWLYERDMIVILEKVNKKGKDKIQLVTYNPKNSATTLVTEICDFKSGMKIKNVTESVFTSVYYVYVSNNEGYDRCYRIDINNDKFDVPLKGAGMENMKVIPHKDRLIYDDVVNSSIYATSPNTKLKFNTNNKLRLIGIDRNDVIYIGEVSGDKICGIVYGKIDESTSKWNSIKLDSPANSSDIFFNSKSEIMVNNILEEKIKNITTGKEYPYTGKFIDVKDDFIALDDNGKLVFQKIKEN